MNENDNWTGTSSLRVLKRSQEVPNVQNIEERSKATNLGPGTVHVESKTILGTDRGIAKRQVQL